MDTNNSFKTPIASFRRLIEQDFSDRFKIIFNSSSQQKETIELSQNEARIISKKINNICMVDPTLDHYELFIPNNIQDQEKEEDKKNIINLIIRSTRERVIIPKNKQKLFSIIQFLLGDDSDNIFEIQNVTEAISLLNSEMENIAIKYLSEHFLDLIESDKMNNLNEDIIFAIIDEYASKENEKIKKDDDEFKKIFSIIKDQEDEGIVIHFILSVKIEYTGEIINELFEYLSEHLNDEIVSNELPRITLFIKNIFENKGKVTRKKGQIIECKFNGDLSGIVSYLKNKIGNDLEKNDALKLSGGGSPDQKHPITNGKLINLLVSLIRGLNLIFVKEK